MPVCLFVCLFVRVCVCVLVVNDGGLKLEIEEFRFSLLTSYMHATILCYLLYPLFSPLALPFLSSLCDAMMHFERECAESE